jgi:Kef-type K+ transport system membrane component KefB
MQDEVLTSFFYIFSFGAIVASLALYSRQPLLVAYIFLGALLGPFGLELISDIDLIAQIGSIGIVFLLFLLGLDMQPQALWRVLKQVTHITLISSLLFALIGYSVARLFDYSELQSVIIGCAMMFSSTIIGIKLLPTTVLHHRHSGELMIGMLLMQDFLAIAVLLLIMSGDIGSGKFVALSGTIISLPLLIGTCFLMVKFVLLPLFLRFDTIGEYTFLLATGWCLGIAKLAHAMGLSHEIGAFLAGISLATSPIAQIIALNLKPLRDFFLILFFFSLGGGFNLELLSIVALPAIVLAALMLSVKPFVYHYLLRKQSESHSLAWDIGFRLGQNSEFSLMIAYLAFSNGLLTTEASHLIQATAIITFLISSYLVVFNFPTPIAVKDSLRRD